MIPAEAVEYAERICLRAGEANIHLREIELPGPRYVFHWKIPDPDAIGLSGDTLKGDSNRNRQAALVSACLLLAEYYRWP